jgi:hypothetical protein
VGGQAAVRCRVVTDATLSRANQPEEQAKQPDLLDVWVIFMDISAGQGVRCLDERQGLKDRRTLPGTSG